MNGLDADVAPGAEVPVGAALAWWYVVTDTGDVRLDAVTVADSGELAVTCPKVSVEPGSSMTGTASSTAAAGRRLDADNTASCPLEVARRHGRVLGPGSGREPPRSRPKSGRAGQLALRAETAPVMPSCISPATAP